MKGTGCVSGLAVLVLFLGSCAGSRNANKEATRATVNKGVWQYAPLTIDGNDSDWTEPLLFTAARPPVGYAVTNDERNLYSVLKTADRITQAKILYNGIALRLSTGKRSGKAPTLHYPLPAAADNGAENETAVDKKQPHAGDAAIYEAAEKGQKSGLLFCRTKARA